MGNTEELCSNICAPLMYGLTALIIGVSAVQLIDCHRNAPSLRQKFCLIADTNKDGIVSREEIGAAYRQTGRAVSEDIVKNIFNSYKENKQMMRDYLSLTDSTQ